MTDRQKLAAAWAGLLGGLPGARGDVAGTGARLLGRWGDPGRGYHDLTHLAAVLAHLDTLDGDPGSAAADPVAVRLAAWYHDAVYAGRPDDEENSARLAEAELPALGLRPGLVGEVARLVRATKEHDPAPGDRNGEALCDADMAILAAPAAVYDAYAAGVRHDYAHVPDGPFAAGRAAFLRGALDGPPVFRTPYGRARWEPTARANMIRELGTLTARSHMDAALAPTAVGQIALQVTSVAEAEAFYAGTLGLRHLYTYGDLTFFACGQTRLFLSAVAPEDWKPGSIVYLRVADLQATHAALSGSVAFTHPPHMIHRHADGVEEWMAFFTDPSGNVLALMSQVGGSHL